MHTQKISVTGVDLTITLQKSASTMENVDTVEEMGTWKVCATRKKLANLEHFSLQSTAPKCTQICSKLLCLFLKLLGEIFHLTPPPLPDTVRETFLADTGANQHLHPNGRSAISFSRVSLDISTAAAGNSMRSEGVGAMKLYTPTG